VAWICILERHIAISLLCGFALRWRFECLLPFEAFSGFHFLRGRAAFAISEDLGHPLEMLGLNLNRFGPVSSSEEPLL
jgi:hypothetical protein